MWKLRQQKLKRGEFNRHRSIWIPIIVTAILIAASSALLLATTDHSQAEHNFPSLDSTNGGNRPAAQTQTNGVFIRSYRVEVEITDQIARTRIEQVFVNESSRAAEGTYVFPLPPGVTVSDLVMVIDGQAYAARILEKQEAKEIYTEIVQEMRDPALLEYIGTNAIEANVFPIPPGGERTLEIEYSQLLPVDQGLVNYIYPLRVDHLSRLPVGSLNIRISVESNDPISTIYSPTHPIAIDRQGDNAFVAGFETTNTHETNDFSLYYGLANDEINLNLLTFRESATEDGFFLALIAPPLEVDQERVIPKDVIVVLDQSGSMVGEKWDQAREATRFVLANLNPEDRFNLVVFSTGMRLFATDLQPASESIEAQQWLDTLFAEGGTGIDAALSAALEMNDHEHQVVILFLTDGLATEGVTGTDHILENVAARTSDNVRFFTFGVGDDVNTFLLDELSQQHQGVSAYVRLGESINEAVSTLYQKIRVPVLTTLALDFDDIMVYDVYPAPDELPDLFAGTQMMIMGRYRRSNDDVTLRLSGNVEHEMRTFTYEGLDFRANAGGEVLIPRLWATRRIGDLMNTIRLEGESIELIDSIVQLSIRYGIITPYTSFIITEEDIFTDQDVANVVAAMEPTAQAMAVNSSGSSAVNAAQQAGNMVQSTMVATLPPGAFVLPTGTPPPTMTAYPSATGTMRPNPTLMGTADIGLAVTASAVPLFSTATSFTSAGPTNTTTLTGTPSATATPHAQHEAVPMQTIQTVEDRTFVWRNGVWIDTTYDPEEMTPEEIVFLSDRYFALLEQDERVAQFFALGDHVIFVLDGQAYEVVPE